MSAQLTSYTSLVTRNPGVDAVFLEEWHSIRQDSQPGQGSSGEDESEENTTGILALTQLLCCPALSPCKDCVHMTSVS